LDTWQLGSGAAEPLAKKELEVGCGRVGGGVWKGRGKIVSKCQYSRGEGGSVRGGYGRGVKQYLISSKGPFAGGEVHVGTWESKVHVGAPVGCGVGVDRGLMLANGGIGWDIQGWKDGGSGWKDECVGSGGHYGAMLGRAVERGSVNC
jgi:hypothetical protein